MGWLELNIAHAATAANIDAFAQSRDWRIASAARGAQHALAEASIAGEDGGIYRAKARRYIIGLTAELRRGWGR